MHELSNSNRLRNDGLTYRRHESIKNEVNPAKIVVKDGTNAEITRIAENIPPSQQKKNGNNQKCQNID